MINVLEGWTKYDCSFYISTSQVAIEVEREEDGGTAGETFTDYVSNFFLFKIAIQFLFDHSSCNSFSDDLSCTFFSLFYLFIFYLQHPSKLSIGPPHPDPIVETSSLSAVQPPEPTYDLKIKDDLENSNALSCLQIETLVYACQVSFSTLLCMIYKYLISQPSLQPAWGCFSGQGSPGHVFHVLGLYPTMKIILDLM